MKRSLNIYEAIRFRFLVGLSVCLFSILAGAEEGRYLDQSQFLGGVFGNATPEQGVLWVSTELRESVESLLGRRFSMLRIRYWFEGDKTAWILDEIGKEEPITIGVSVEDDRISSVRVLEFRESRGWEVRYPFFTDQFRGARLVEHDKIDRRIDGITGATLSVAAVNRVVRLALMLDEQVGTSDRSGPTETKARAY
jgi:hypothetical protein